MNDLEYRDDHIDELIGKYLAGEATPAESAQVEAWASAADSNRRHLEHLRLIFDKAATITAWPEFNTDAAWNKVKANLKKAEGKTISLQPPSPTIPTWVWRVAASVVLLLAAGLYWYKIQTPAVDIAAVEIATKEKALSDTLPDGSGVFLNKGTSLAFRVDKKGRHQVKLKGEAYFSVKHDTTREFVIDVNGIYIRDIGTSFNVKAYPELNTVEVLVEEGEVQFYTDNNPGIYLRPGGKGIYNKTTGQFTIRQPEENVLAYKTRFFAFSNTTLQEAVATLNAVYDQKITLAPGLEKCRLTVSFRDEDIDIIVAVMAETLSLDVKEENGQYILSGEGCGQ